ncbi:MAG: hypothetical protein ABIQ44_06880 [Chloroflexia bacterium]
MKWRGYIRNTLFGVLVPLLALALFASQRPKVWAYLFFQPAVWTLGALVVVAAVVLLIVTLVDRVRNRQ